MYGNNGTYCTLYAVCMYVLFIQLGVSCVDTKVVEVRMNVVIYVLVYHGMCMFTVRSSS